MTTAKYDAALAALRELNTEQLFHLLLNDYRWIQRTSVSKEPPKEPETTNEEK